jgi:HK97 family phage major capsid protein
MKLPSIVEIVNDRVGNSRLTKGQLDYQNELRAEMPNNGEAGYILPFYGKESRGMSAMGTTTTSLDQGGQTIATVVPEIGTALRDNLVLEKLGARVWGGLQANTSFPRVKTAIASAWMTESAAATVGQDLYGTLAMVPHRVVAYLDVSDQLLRQSPHAEANLRQDLMQALAVGIQSVAANGSGASGQPTGILQTSGIDLTVVGGANGAAPTGANICDLEYVVTGKNKADRGSVGWLFSPYVRRKLRQTPIITGSGWPIMQNDDAYRLLGHPAGVTPSAPDNLTKGTSNGICSAIICGEFSELFVGIFGAGVAIDAVRDAALASQNLTRVYATAYIDLGVRSPESFAAMKDALCA